MKPIKLKRQENLSKENLEIALYEEIIVLSKDIDFIDEISGVCSERTHYYYEYLVVTDGILGIISNPHSGIFEHYTAEIIY